MHDVVVSRCEALGTGVSIPCRARRLVRGKVFVLGRGSSRAVGNGMSKIVVIDPNPVARLEMVNLSRAEGYPVLESGDGLAALQVIVHECPAVVLVEVLMPRVDGFALCHQLKTDPVTASIPIVLLARSPHGL